MKGAPIVLLVAGCFSKPGPPADGVDATCTPSQPSNPGLLLTPGAAPLATFLDGAQLGFANDLTAYPMPNRIIINNVNLVATPEGCAAEDQIGVSAFPAYSISASSPLSSTVHGLDRMIVGPAFTALQVNWEFAYTCSSGMTVGRGQTQFSLFPDGRIVRNDTIMPSTTRTVTTAGCRCAAAASEPEFLVTSYSAFETQHFSAVTMASANTDATAVPVPSLTATRNQLGACLTAISGGRVAVRWDVVGPEPAAPPTRIRFVQTPSSHREIALVYDLLSMEADLGPADSVGVRTHMLLDDDTDGNCVAHQRSLDAFVAVAPLRIAGIDTPYGGFGVFQDDSRTFTGPVELDAAIGSIPPGFVVGLRIPGFSAIRTDPPVAGVVWQRESNDTFYVFFPAGLTSGETVTITPEC